MNPKRAVVAAAGAVLALSTPIATWAAPALSTPAVSAAEQAQLVEIARRGRLIYAYDQAAWHGTDDMRAKVPDFQDRVGGWIVDGPAESARLIFYDRNASDPGIVYLAEFSGSRLVSSRVLGAGDDRSLSPARKAMIAARQSAIDAVVAAKSGFCGKAMPNTVVLPPAGPGDPTLVYILSPQRVMDALPFGGHYLVPVDPGGEAGPVRRFTNTCLELPLPNAKEREKTVALGVTHLLDPLPTEIHVFSSLAAGMPVAVGTRDERTWWVDGSDIRLVGKDGR